MQKVYSKDQGNETGERTLVKIESRSRPGRSHFLDVENERCSCEGFGYTGSCYHVEQLKCAFCAGYGTIISYPKLTTCHHCDGSGRAA